MQPKDEVLSLTLTLPLPLPLTLPLPLPLPLPLTLTQTYTFEDVCTQGAQIASGKMSLNASDSVDENGDRIYPVPKATMARWMKTTRR